MANDGRPPAGFGCLGMVLGTVVLVGVVVLVFFVGLLALGVVAALAVVGLVALAVDRLALALSPRRRERRAERNQVFLWRFGQMPTDSVIDTTAIDTTAVDTTAIDTTSDAQGDPDDEGPRGGTSGPG